MESALEPVRDGKHIPTKSLIDELYKALTLLENLIQSKKLGSQSTFSEAEIQQQIHRLNPSSLTETTTSVSARAQDNVPRPDATEITQNKEADTSSSVRVPVALLDSLMTLMGEMVLVRNQVLQFSSQSEDLDFLNLSQRLNVVTSEIQGEMMKTRMQPIGNILNKFHRVVRDLSVELKKNITLHLSGTDTELDKSLLEAIKDPLTHIIRNSCDHGIEVPEVRKSFGKSEDGNIFVKSYHEGGQIVIEVSDDGKGLNRGMLIKKSVEKGLITEAQAQTLSDKDVLNLIFLPGFSTATAVTNLSGRGVGMDVVRTNIEKIGGTVDLSSEEGRGTQIKLKIPLTLAIVPALIVGGSQNTYAIPQVKLVELVRVDATSEIQIEFLQETPVYRLRGEILPLIHIDQILGLKADFNIQDVTNIAVLNAESHNFGLIVNTINDTADIVVKPLNRLLKSLNAYSGATILGDGSVALILDVAGLAKLAKIHVDTHKNLSQDLADSQASKNSNQKHDEQDFLLFKLNSPTHHAIVLNYVHRLEEFRRSDIEVTGGKRVIRYRNSMLPLICANSFLGYGVETDQAESPRLHVIVVQRAGFQYGIEVTSIVDTVSTNVELEANISERLGILGNLSTPQELIVVIDPIEMILESFPLSPDKSGNHLREREKNDSGSLEHIPTSGGGLKILVVEDTAFFRKHVTKILKDHNHSIFQAKDGVEALDILGKQNFDLIISDIEMPRMNGFQLATAVRKHPKFKEIPMMALSSRFDPSFVQKGIAVGFDKYLEKVNAPILLATVQELTQKARSAA